MPYIDPERREDLDPVLECLADAVSSGGELNYCVTYLAKSLAQREGGPSYSAYRGVLGDLFGAVLEFYRVDVAHYEELKRRSNGDVLLRDPEETTERGW